MAAEKFSAKTIKLLQGSSPGRTTMSRMLASLVTECLGQPVVVATKIGATGTVTAGEVAHSKPDGYTLLSTPILELVIAPHQVKVK